MAPLRATPEIIDEAVRATAGQMTRHLGLPAIPSLADVLSETLRPLYPELAAQINAEIERSIQ